MTAEIVTSVSVPASTSTASVLETKKIKAPKAQKIKAVNTSAKSKVALAHPVYNDMIKKAISEIKDRKGSSKAAILKYIIQNYKVGDNVIKVF